MKNIIKRILPRKYHFMGIDIGVCEIKEAEIKIIDSKPEVISLKRYPAPADVWADQFDEERLVQSLKDIANSRLKEVVTCIGGEKVISRIVRLPKMSDKELISAAKFEIAKFVTIPEDQLIIRHICLENNNGAWGKGLKSKNTSSRSVDTREKDGSRSEGQKVLLLSVPVATIYQYYSIFSRAGLTVSAIDLKSFALWRVFGKLVQGAVAIADIGEKTSQLIVVKNGLIDFIRMLATGGDVFSSFVTNACGIEIEEAGQMVNEAAISLENSGNCRAEAYINDVMREDLLHEGMREISKEIHLSLSYYSAQENTPVEKLILTGGACKMKGLTAFLEDVLGIPVEIGIPDVNFAGNVSFDPVFSVAIGLALREVT
ncbi:MAG: pilus assembly protein PilM [Eubacteriales bacterium]|nr:pilus assembly protein PilM [Bacillota bacterium]